MQGGHNSLVRISQLVGTFFSPSIIHNTVKWFLHIPALPIDRGCHLTPNPLEAASGDVVDYQYCNGHPYNQGDLVGYDANLHKFVKLYWYSQDAQDFIHGVVQETNGFNAIHALTAQGYLQASFEYPLSTSVPISHRTMLTN